MMIKDEDAAIRAALSMSPEKVDCRLLEKFYMPRKLTKSVKAKERGDPDTIEDVLDENGEPLVENEVWLRYEVSRSGVEGRPTTIEAPLKHLLSVNMSAAADDYMANCSKARAAALLSQLDDMERGAANHMPEGHLPLDHMGLNPHFIASLKHFGIHSVQQLRDATEAKIASLPGGLQAHRLRDEANAFLIRNQASMIHETLAAERAEKEQLKGKVDELSSMVEKLMAALGVDGSDDKPKRGRPPKVDAQPEAAAA